jgi:hypothetical protein
MKTLSIVTAAILLGLGGTAMAMGGGDHGSGEGSNTNTTGSNPYMPEFSAPSSQGRSALGQHPAQHRVVTHHVKK